MRDISRAQIIKWILARNSIVFIYGPSGTGKSHAVREALRETKTLFTTGKEFQSRFLAWYEKKPWDKTKLVPEWKQCQALVIEDIDLGLVGMEATQTVLRNYVRSFVSAGGSVVFTSVCQPNKMRYLTENVLYIDLHYTILLLAERLAILRSWMQRDKVSLPESSLKHIARKNKNIFSLHSAFNALVLGKIINHHRAER